MDTVNPGAEQITSDQCSEGPCCLESVKKTVADVLHGTAQRVGEKAATLDPASDFARYGRQAADWLEHSADCVRNFDYVRTEENVRSYIRQSPGRSLLMASAAGLLIGILLRRSR